MQFNENILKFKVEWRG